MDTGPAWRTASDRGVREVNADAVAAAGGVVALADGVGDDTMAAHAALAATTAAVGVPALAGPAAALAAAHDAVTAGDCVLVAAQPFGGGYRIGWVGDVRAYAWDGGELRQLTKDHTLAQYFRDHGGDITPRMGAPGHRQRAHRARDPLRRNGNQRGEPGPHHRRHPQDPDPRGDDGHPAPCREPGGDPGEAAHKAGASDNATAVVLTGAAAPLLTKPLPIAA